VLEREVIVFIKKKEGGGERDTARLKPTGLKKEVRKCLRISAKPASSQGKGNERRRGPAKKGSLRQVRGLKKGKGFRKADRASWN